MKYQVLLLSLLCFFFSCEEETVQVTDTVALEPFRTVILHDPFEVFLAEGDSYSVEVVGDKKVIASVDFDIEDSILHIQNTRKAKWRSPTKNKISLYVTAPPLKVVRASEGCHIQTLTPITSDEFGLTIKGKASKANITVDTHTFFYWNAHPSGGKVTVKGRTEVLKIWNIALMSIDAKELTCRYALIENSSKGDCEATVSDRLEYSIEGTGNILLHGNPGQIIEKSMSSTGRLIQY